MIIFIHIWLDLCPFHPFNFLLHTNFLFTSVKGLSVKSLTERIKQSILVKDYNFISLQYAYDIEHNEFVFKKHYTMLKFTCKSSQWNYKMLDISCSHK
jgi:hypothetical protein